MIPPSELRYVEVADVFKLGERAATLTRTKEGIRFEYSPDYRAGGGSPIATHLQFDEPPINARYMPAYFSNLLPEGVRLLALRDRTKTSLDDDLTMLLAVGRDCIGDVSIVPQGESPELTIEDVEPALDVEALFARAAAADDPHAIPGVQEKVSSDMLTYPRLSIFGPAIVKLAPPKLPNLIRNEHFFMQMAEACGIVSAKTDVAVDEHGREALWVRRFDRRKTPNGWVRLAQEDGCQLTDNYPANKYRLSIRDLAQAFENWSDAPVVAQQKLLAQVAFSFLIGNGDLHAKNISLGQTAQGMMPTPAYDLLSSLPYPGYDQHMALRMDGRDSNFRRKHFKDFFQRFGVGAKAVDRTLDRILDKSVAWIDRLDEIGFDEQTTIRLRRDIIERRERLA